MAICKSVVLGTGGVTDRVMKLIKRTAVNTSSGFVMDAIRVLLDQGEQTVGSLSDKCQLSEPNVRAALNDMRDLGLVSSSRRGHRAMIWSVSNEVARLWEKAK